ncbi:MAG: S9 family peptidase, partial [Candidatus Aminicenantes bacterium]
MRKTIPVVLLIFAFVFSLTIFAQEPYKLPPKEVIDIVDAPPLPRASMNPTGDLMLLSESESMPSIAYMSQPLLRLAGTRITPRYNSRQQTSFIIGLTIKSIKDGKETRIALPKEAKLSFPRWSLDGKWLAFPLLTDTGFELWIAEARTGKAKALTGPILNSTVNSGFSWLPGNKLLVYTILEDRGDPPKKSDVPVGPNIQETAGRFATVRTYQDLLQTQHDAALFKYYATSQIYEIDIESGSRRKIGKPGFYLYVDPSPDGKLLLVYRVKEPYSFSVPYYSFPHSDEIWDRDGNLVHLFADLPVEDEVPIRGVPKGPRSVGWRALKPATLIWVEALDEGNPEKQVAHRDKLMTLSAPFTGTPKEIMKIKHRYGGISWLQPAGQAFLTESQWKKRWRTTYLVNVDNPSQAPKKVFDISTQDRYNDPGRPLSTTTPNGERIILQDKDWIYLIGSGASPKGDMPFLDTMNIKT